MSLNIPPNFYEFSGTTQFGLLTLDVKSNFLMSGLLLLLGIILMVVEHLVLVMLVVLVTFRMSVRLSLVTTLIWVVWALFFIVVIASA